LRQICGAEIFISSKNLSKPKFLGLKGHSGANLFITLTKNLILYLFQFKEPYFKVEENVKRVAAQIAKLNDLCSGKLDLINEEEPVNIKPKRGGRKKKDVES